MNSKIIIISDAGVSVNNVKGWRRGERGRNTNPGGKRKKVQVMVKGFWVTDRRKVGSWGWGRKVGGVRRERGWAEQNYS